MKKIVFLYPCAGCVRAADDCRRGPPGEDAFTIEITGNEDFQGSWTIQKDGDFLTVSFPETDYSGATLSVYVLQAAAE